MSGPSNRWQASGLVLRLCILAAVLGLQFGVYTGRQWFEKQRRGTNTTGRVTYPERINAYPERVNAYPERVNPYERPAANAGAGSMSPVDTMTSVITSVGVIVVAAAGGLVLWVVASLFVRRKASSDPRAIAESDPWLRTKMRERDAALQKWIGAPECRNAEPAAAAPPATVPSTSPTPSQNL